MKLIHTDFNQGLVKLQITDTEDLWYLQQLIDPGDYCTARTTRKIRVGGDDSTSTARKAMTLTIEVETVALSDDCSTLRVNGRVREGPEEVPRDSYHALELQESTECTLQKVSWLQFQRQKLEEACRARYNYLLCLLEREEALLALTRPKGYEVLARLQGEASKKRLGTQVRKEFWEEVKKALETYDARYQPERIILASPAFYKEEVLQRITIPGLKSKIVLATCSDASEHSLDEVISSPELALILQESKARQDTLLVEELLKEIGKEHLAVYGWKEVQAAAQAGAVRMLLLTDAFLRRRRQEGAYRELEELMKHVDALQGETHLISSAREAGRKLDGLGGVGAVLRYKYSAGG